MDLRVIYGWHLDGPSYPEQPAVGTVALGPTGLLHQLALRLGLVCPFPHMALRIAEYAAILRSLDNPSRFYSRSFNIDPWGTARALIHLRDELVGCGWDRKRHQSDSQRLQTLAEIENQSLTRLSQLNDLALPIAEMLESGAKVPIAEIQLIDGEASLPPIWRRIIRALATSSTTIRDFNISAQDGSRDVSKLARSLAHLQKVECTIDGDGSFSLVESDDEVQAADFMSSLLAASSPGDTVVIRGSDTSLLDRLLHKRGLPILGGAPRSPLRGVIQLLPLTFELCWNPIDPMRILEFLALPYSPVPNFAGACFAYAIRGQPGIGGSAWLNAWQTALARKRTALEREQQDNVAIEKALEQSERNWKEWLEPSRFDPSEGMDALHVVAACKRVRNHAIKMHSVQQRSIFAELAVYADVLADTVELTGLTKIPRAQLDRMLESVIGGGYKADEPEASQWVPVDHPGQIYAPASTVIWWGFNNNLSPPRPNAWTQAELAALSAQSVDIEKPASAIAREAKSWRRPFVVGCERIILIKPRTVAGRSVAAHPFFHELSGVLDSSSPAVRAKTVSQANVIYDSPKAEVCGHTLVRQYLPGKLLPAAHRIWKVSPYSVPLREESPSSLERLLGCPLNWLLRLGARIRPGNLISVAHGDQLSGNLAHAVFAALFSRLDPDLETDIAYRTELLFDELCPKVAATLLMPGNSLERLRLKRSLSEAAVHLLALIKKAGFRQIECESERHAKHGDIQLVGRSDMVLRFSDKTEGTSSKRSTNYSTKVLNDMSGEDQAAPTSEARLALWQPPESDGRTSTDLDVVLDLKWARRGVYRRREIEEGRAVQLAIYAWLCQKESNRSTIAAYYMLSQKQLFTTSKHPFPEYTYVDGPPLDDTFTRVMESYLVHLRSLSDGTIYATGIQNASQGTDGIAERFAERLVHDDSTEALSPVPGVSLILEPPCKFCEYGRLCGKKELTK